MKCAMSVPLRHALRMNPRPDGFILLMKLAARGPAWSSEYKTSVATTTSNVSSTGNLHASVVAFSACGRECTQ